MSGAKLALDYGYKLTGGAVPFWLNLLLNVQHGELRRRHGRRRRATARPAPSFETLAGVKWKFATPIPLVPYVKAAGRARVSRSRTERDAARGLAWRAARRRELLLLRLAGARRRGRLLARAASTTTRPSPAATPTRSSTSAAASSSSFERAVSASRSALRARRRSWAWRRSGSRGRSAVTRMSSSMRTPRPRNSGGAAASSAM